MINVYKLFEDTVNVVQVENDTALVEADTTKSIVKAAVNCQKFITKTVRPALKQQLEQVKNKQTKALKTTANIIKQLMKVDSYIIKFVEDMHSKTTNDEALNEYIKTVQSTLESYINSFTAIAQEQSDGKLSRGILDDILNMAKKDGTIWSNMLKTTVKHVGNKAKDTISNVGNISKKTTKHKNFTSLFESIQDVIKAIDILDIILRQYIDKYGH